MPAGEGFDLIVSNPPTSPANGPHLDQGDLRFSARGCALTDGAGEAGRPGAASWPRRRAPEARRAAMDGYGWDQAQAVRGLLADAGFESVHSRHDLAGIEKNIRRALAGRVTAPAVDLALLQFSTTADPRRARPKSSLARGRYPPSFTGIYGRFSAVPIIGVFRYAAIERPP